jgi:uracil-DNA glycosylase family protein
MMASVVSGTAGFSADVLARPAASVPTGSLPTLVRRSRECQACPIGRLENRTVFGEGPPDARVMLVGEQPGNDEDLGGRPFIGPAGRLLDRALGEAGLQRERLYLTNTVKRFKYEPRGKARLHKRASAAEQAACRMWLAAELEQVAPGIVVALGAMAAQAFLGPSFRVTRSRGEWQQRGAGVRVLATWHPSAILRARDDREQRYRELVADLRRVADAARALD